MAISLGILAIVLVAINGLIVGAYFLGSGAGINMAVKLSDMLFIEGGIVLLAGVAIEFFHSGGRENHLIVIPLVLFQRKKGGSANRGPESSVEVKNPGWFLIFLGALLLAFSVAFILFFAR